MNMSASPTACDAGNASCANNNDQVNSSNSAAAAAVALVDSSDDEERIDFSKLHPSVRFYRGMWKLTQLSEVTPSTETSSSSQGKDVEVHPTTPAQALRTSSSNADLAFSVVALHQQLLPPAPVNGLGEIADESYAAQLATPDGIEFLRLHWRLLLPLLFPSCRPCGTELGGEAETHPHSCSESATELHEAPQSSDTAAPESRWSAQELYRRVQQPLTEVDLKVIREPGHMDRIYYSYIVLLRFYGWRVHDEERGLLDRNRAWAERYAALEQYRVHEAQQQNLMKGEEEDERVSPSTCTTPPPPTYANFNFYSDGLPRVLRGLLDVGFLRLAVRLVEFVMEEMKSNRLQFLLPLVQSALLPLVVNHPNVEASHKTRLQKQLYRLTHSDSD